MACTDGLPLTREQWRALPFTEQLEIWIGEKQLAPFTFVVPCGGFAFLAVRSSPNIDYAFSHDCIAYRGETLRDGVAVYAMVCVPGTDPDKLRKGIETLCHILDLPKPETIPPAPDWLAGA